MQSNPSEDGEALRFALRMRWPRTVGLALGCLAIAAVLREIAAPPLAWAALAVNGFAWAQIAYLISSRSAEPRHAELRNLMIDSASGGFWIVVMDFNVLPSVLLAVTLSMDKLSVGGPRFLARTTLAMLGGGACAALLVGLEFRPHTSMTVLVACLPHLVVYPLVVGMATYRLSRRVRAQNLRLAELSRTDGLTGVANRSHWEETADQEFQRYSRGGKVSSILLLDIDHFKRINDTHGHHAGDEVIRRVAAILRESVRGQDTVGRYGGEEFGVVLPDTDDAAALAVAERMRARIEAATLEPRAGVRATASIGLAALRGAEHGHSEWIQRADRALYRAKELGRNRVERG